MVVSRFEANCWRRCSNVFILLKLSMFNEGFPASQSSGYCLPMEQTSL